MRRLENSDNVSRLAVEKSEKKLPFRWWTKIDFADNGKVYATIHYHTGRGSKDPKRPYSDGGKSQFVFSEEEVMNVVPMATWMCNLAIPNALGKAKWQIDQINLKLHQMIQDIVSLYGNDASRSDAAIIEAFSLVKADGTMKPEDDPFVWRLRIIALHEALIELASREPGFYALQEKIRQTAAAGDARRRGVI